MKINLTLAMAMVNRIKNFAEEVKVLGRREFIA